MREFYVERRIKATAKPHFCEGCRRTIEPKSAAIYFSVKQEGEFWTGHYHTECRDAEVAWNDAADQWGDEYSPLSSIKECDDSEDWCAWLLDHHPVVADRLNLAHPMTPASIAGDEHE